MPLLDHFRPPLSERRHWEAFHGRWASAIADCLNSMGLPEHYFAEPTVSTGRVQVDVATFEEDSPPNTNGPTGKGGSAIGTLPQSATVAAPAWAMPATFPDSFEVHVINSEGGPKLAAAIELVSPSNKDRTRSRRAFAVKCANFLYQGIPFIVIDIVTSRSANLHNAIMEVMQTEGFLLPAGINLYATAYRPVRRESRGEIDVWHEPVALSQPLPRLPLFLDVDLSAILDFEASYQETCDRLRLGTI